MKKFAKIILIALGFGLVTVAAGFLTSNPTPAANVSGYGDADRPTRNSFDASCSTGQPDPVYGQASCTIFTIPAGRQVVIETAACTAAVPTGTGVGQADLIIPNIPYGGGAPINYYYNLAMTLQSNGAPVDLWGMTTQFRAYAAAPSSGTVGIGVFFRSGASAAIPEGMSCTISGYLVAQHGG